MKILYFHQHFSTPDGAAGTRSYEMASRLVSNGHQVLMVCGSYGNGITGLTGPFRGGKRRGWVEGIEVIEFNLAYSNRDGVLRRAWTFVKFAIRSMRLAISEKSDIVFATTTPLTAALPGIAAKWIRRRPFVFEVRDLWPELPKAMGVITNKPVLWALGMLEWLAYKSADRIIGLSPGIADGTARFGKAPRAIAMIPNGCDVRLFQDPVEPWRPAEISGDDFLAVFTGTHGIANGLDAIIDAATILKKRGATGIKALLIGDGKEKRQLIERVRVERLEEYIVFHNPVPKTQLTGLLASADLGLQILANVPAFYYGTSPNKFFDYLAAGLPILTNYPGWIADMVEDNQCGMAIPAANPELFATALINMANKSEIDRAAMGERAKKLAHVQFNRDHLFVKFSNHLLGS
ncbi:glycosyltransferase family 4 protein [Parasphingorhabdus flavimaris]|uniref:Glycosyltransferase family 4 protein n=1 Tax=Parasphingorhabdus flavimaris TaxID=266812 RepID=A0ABX2N5M6_9SPHN|nr:glycosyltransferase family 4 protein [Parasphingorhabdus flavimaris]NVD29027.1 glycosyltransferase family 4 protein [Parasphingorhabdus flavimaris]